MKNVHYCDEKFSNLSIDQLLSYRGDTPFDQQVVMYIDQQGVYTKNQGVPISIHFLLMASCILKRNPNGGQIYRLKRLQASLHLSNSIAVVHEIDFRLRFLINGHNCIPITLSVEQTQNVTIEEIGLFIHNTDDAIPNINESNLLNDNTYMDANLPPIPTDPNIPINTSRANMSQNC